MASSTRTETVTPAVIHILPTAGEASESAAANSAVVVSEPLKQVSWEEGTLDNENLGKKSSKVCCIYHKPRAFAESSSESSSSSSDSSDEEGAKKAGSKHRKSRKSSNRQKAKKGEDQQHHQPCHGGPTDEKQAADKAQGSPKGVDS
ncbi:hypothetical protein Emed_004997 [Eimeria media]